MSNDQNSPPYTYKAAGVDIDAGNELVQELKPIAAQTARLGADAALGGFGALFDLKAAGYEDPIIVAATDGVGTKLKIALELHHHQTIGIDLVAMCVNDLIAQGAEPLFMMDYLAVGKLSQHIAVEVIQGVADGCRQAGCALIGGETAEMPGLYQESDYDLAGFAVGAADRGQLLPHKDIQDGDVLLGIASSGLHANGFSLVRRLVQDQGLKYWDAAPFDPDRKLGDALLEPTRIYIKSLLGAIHAGKIKALAHITGGGLTENVPRVLPKGCLAEINLEAWTLPAVFDWLQTTGSIEQTELLRTFNCGIGMVIVTAPENVALLKKSLPDSGETIFEVGRIAAAANPDAAPEVHYLGKLRP